MISINKKKKILIGVILLILIAVLLLNKKEKSLGYAEELGIVSDYISSNLDSVITEKAVLGGTWYIVSIDIDSINDTGNIVYEDGHIQGGIDFTYQIDSKTKEIVSLEVLN